MTPIVFGRFQQRTRRRPGISDPIDPRQGTKGFDVYDGKTFVDFFKDFFVAMQAMKLLPKGELVCCATRNVLASTVTGMTPLKAAGSRKRAA